MLVNLYCGKTTLISLHAHVLQSSSSKSSSSSGSSQWAVLSLQLQPAFVQMQFLQETVVLIEFIEFLCALAAPRTEVGASPACRKQRRSQDPYCSGRHRSIKVKLGLTVSTGRV